MAIVPTPFIGMVHLLPLPGSPRGGFTLGETLNRALGDTAALLEGGANGIIIENFGDSPFSAGQATPYTVAAMTHIALEVRKLSANRMVGINILRNDALSALSVATAANADFIRVNVHISATLTDQGILTGRARQTLMEINRLNSAVKIAADVDVKHGAQVAPRPIVELATETALRGCADYLIVTGTGTGSETSLSDLKEVKAALPSTEVWVGSGVNASNLSSLASHCDGVIVGTELHENADISEPISAARTAKLVELWRSLA